MVKNILKSLALLALFFMLTAQQGCQTTSSLGEKKLSSNLVKLDNAKYDKINVNKKTEITLNFVKYNILI